MKNKFPGPRAKEWIHVPPQDTLDQYKACLYSFECTFHTKFDYGNDDSFPNLKKKKKKKKTLTGVLQP